MPRDYIGAPKISKDSKTLRAELSYNTVGIVEKNILDQNNFFH
jgi:hypothetical protein